MLERLCVQLYLLCWVFLLCDAEMKLPHSAIMEEVIVSQRSVVMSASVLEHKTTVNFTRKVK